MNCSIRNVRCQKQIFPRPSTDRLNEDGAGEAIIFFLLFQTCAARDACARDAAGSVTVGRVKINKTKPKNNNSNNNENNIIERRRKRMDGDFFFLSFRDTAATVVSVHNVRRVGCARKHPQTMFGDRRKCNNYNNNKKKRRK